MMSVFVEDHDFKKYPELSNAELASFGMMSPHPQITEDFSAVVVKVVDGDTVRLECDFRDFSFPLRMIGIDAPELNTGTPGMESRDFLKSLIEGETVGIKIDRDNRVGKYGRLLGGIVSLGVDVGELMVMFGHAWPFSQRLSDQLPDLNKVLRLRQWF